MTTANALANDIKREIYGAPDGDAMTEGQARAETLAAIADLKNGGGTDEYWFTREEKIAQLEKLL